jgi:hypothetical protein|tara:strand:- start:1704 stop:2912 length:1209 start_codon:yes stop_codon:yes gene_type:complete
MGFFSKVFKSVGKVFKKIGKGIKSAFAKVGKFMGKLGILGQIGLGLLLPGIGGMLGKWAVTAMGSSSAIVSAAGHFVNAAVNIGTKVGSVFKTVTEGVTAVVGETVGAALNVIPGADKLVLSATKGLGINAGQGINIANKSFSSIFDVAGKAMTNVASAGRNLFSMDTLTGTNKFALKDQLQKQLKKDIGDPFRSTEQTLAEKIQATDFDAPKLADGSIDQFAIDPNMPIDSSISKALQAPSLAPTASSSLLAPNMTVPSVSLENLKGLDLSGIDVDVPTGTIADTVVKEAVEETPSWMQEQIKKSTDKLVNTFTDAPSQLLNKGLGINQAPDVIQTQYSSNVVLPDVDSTSIRMSNGVEFDPRAYEQNQDFFNQNPIGNSAKQWGQHQQYLQYSVMQGGNR